MNEELKLYQFYPDGHGELSFFTLAYDEAEAFAIVDAEIKRRSSLPYHDPDYIGDDEMNGWGTDYYQVTCSTKGKILINAND